MTPLLIRLKLLTRQHPLVSLGITLGGLLFVVLSLSSPAHRLPRLLPYEYPIPVYPHASDSPHSAADARIAGLLDGATERIATVYRKHNTQAPKAIFAYPALTRPQEERYHHLRKTGQKYMFTAITRQVADQLPDLINALVVLVHYLGPTAVSFSILEGPSDDLTAVVLDDVLRPLLLSLHIPATQINIVTNSPKIDFNQGNRIEILADLRNQALAPLWNGSDIGRDVDAVISFNDVYLKAEHVLEVLHQHVRNQAGITTAWDWYEREPAYFYDVWVARTVSALYSLHQGLTRA